MSSVVLKCDGLSGGLGELSGGRNMQAMALEQSERTEENARRVVISNERRDGATGSHPRKDKGQKETIVFGARNLHVVLEDELLISVVPRSERSGINRDDDVELTQLDGELGPLSIDMLARHVDVGVEVVDLLTVEVSLVC